MVLVDAAKGCATQPPDLSKYPADFVVVSFYKVFLLIWASFCFNSFTMFSFEQFHIVA